MNKQFIEEITTLFNKKQAVKKYKHHACTWGFIREDGSLTMNSTHYCHAALSRGEGFTKTTVGIINSIQCMGSQHDGGDNLGYIGDDIGKQFTDWLINRSIYSSVFCYKDVEYLWDNKVLIVDVNTHYNLMSAALIASRAISEHRGEIGTTWYHLIQNGVDENLAFVLSHIINWDGHLFVDNYRDWHCALSYAISIDAYKDFINYEPDVDEENFYYNKQTYDKINFLFSTLNNRKDRSLQELLKTVGETFNLKNKDKLFFSEDTTFFKYYIDNNDNQLDYSIECVLEFQNQLENKIK